MFLHKFWNPKSSRSRCLDSPRPNGSTCQW